MTDETHSAFSIQHSPFVESPSTDMGSADTDRLASRLAGCRAAGRTALIPYITAGYPTREATADALAMLVRAGADVIELGVPFSDPVADGPTIQRSSQQIGRAHV